MKILITGVAGFVGITICEKLLKQDPSLQIIGIDNFSRPGSETNLKKLKKLCVPVYRLDVRLASDIESLQPTDWVIDCAANPSVLAGMVDNTSSRQVMEHNLLGTINLLEYCRRHEAGLILLSTSRVYSATKLARLPVKESDFAFALNDGYSTTGISSMGISEDFPTSPPISLYGASNLASEILILE